MRMVTAPVRWIGLLLSELQDMTRRSRTSRCLTEHGLPMVCATLTRKDLQALEILHRQTTCGKTFRALMLCSLQIKANGANAWYLKSIVTQPLPEVLQNS